MEELESMLNTLSIGTNFNDPHKNYDDLVNTIQFLENNDVFPKDWVDEQIEYVEKCREVFPDLECVNPHITTEDFRDKALESEFLIISLMDDIKYGGLNLDNYLKLLQNFKCMVDYLFECESEFMH